MTKAKKPEPAAPNRTWTVKVRCVVMKMLTCEDCTKDEARAEPFEYATDEFEEDQEDWTVVSVQPADLPSQGE